MERIDDYLILEKIDETRCLSIYRCRKEGAKDTVIIKTLTVRHPSASERARFKQEFELIQKFDLPGVIKTLKIIGHNGGYAIVQEDIECVSIKKILDANKRFEIDSFLSIAIKVAETLGNLHARDIIHRDIKPHNIMINTNSGEVKITNFGISSILTHENDEVYNPDFIASTLPYMSPEQTGRISRAIDYRTDLYSLGVALYQMITGVLPFQSRDPMELIHSHIAVMPVPPTLVNTRIPCMISDIVMKLLSKTPEERYQNGFGVMADFKECLKQLEQNGTIEAFTIARHDVSSRFIIPIKLFGRKKELDVLLSSFEEVIRRGSGAAVMVVAGASGIGKSALVNEIHRPIVTKSGYFISGTYEQFRRNKPYSAIIQAFQTLVRQILSEKEENIKRWRENLLTALGANGKVITDVIPGVELIIGKQPELPVLGPEEARNRFKFVFEKFVRVFPKKEHPIVLFLEDLQWADLASFQMIRNIVMSSEIHHFLLIVSYRDNEVDDSHAVMGFLKELEKDNIRVDRVNLAPLTKKDVADIIINFMKCSPEKGVELGCLLYKKTGGNPFFVMQFLHTLYHDKLIELDGVRGWRWDIEKIVRMQITDNLVEMMVGKINKLTVNTQKILKICACIGNRFDLETVAAVSELSIDQVLHDITEAINEGLVSQLADIYIFNHDRIQEAAYSLVPEKEKSKLHYRIGRLALEATREDDLQKKLFYIVDQFNLGHTMIASGRERENLARLNLDAGMKAKASAAYTPAFRYLTFGIELLDENSWERQYELTLALYAESTETAYLMGDFDTMDELAELALRHSKTTLDSVKIYMSRINASLARERYRQVLDEALAVLRLLGVKIPQKPTRLHIAFELLKIKMLIYGKKTEDLINLPLMTDAKLLAAGKIMASMGHAAFYEDPNILVMIILLSLKLSIKYGNSPEYAVAYTGYGIVLAAVLSDFDGAMKYGTMGLEILNKLNARAQECVAIFINNALIRHWVVPLRETIAPMVEGYRIGMETGDLDYALFNLHMSEWHSIFAGVELSELDRTFAKYHQIMSRLNQRHVLTLHGLAWQTMLNFLGQCDDPIQLKGKAADAEKAFSLWNQVNNRAALSTYYFSKLVLCTIYNNYSLAVNFSNKFKKYRDAQQGIFLNRYTVMCDSIARLFLYQDSPWYRKIQYRIQVVINQVKMKRWADSAPANCLHIFHTIEFLHAWLVRGDAHRAEKSLNLAIQLCKKHVDVIMEGITSEFAVNYYRSKSDDQKSQDYLKAAYNAFSRWGANGVLKKLAERYTDSDSQSMNVHNALVDTSSTIISTREVALDFSTVLKASQAISGEIVLGKLLTKMMRIVMENAGAQKGFMILEDKGKFLVEAEGAINSGEIRVLQSIPVESHERLSASIVNYVARTKETLILNDATVEGAFVNDPYVIENKPKSILCSAVLNQGRLSGILYLENNIAIGAFTPERLETLNIISSQIAISIDHAKLYENLEEKVKERTKELQEARDALWGEMQLAKKIQTVLLPKEPAIAGYEIVASMEPAAEVGGDYYDVINGEGKSWIVIGDVSGHGVTAGLVMMMTQTAIHTTVVQNPDISPSAMIEKINRTISENIQKMDEGKFMTITVLAVHENGRFIFSGLHQDIIVYRAHSKKVEMVETNGMWIGAYDDVTGMLHDETFMLDPGDVMLLYTDGITEAWEKNSAVENRYPGRNMFGVDRLRDVLRAHGGSSPDEIRTAVLQALKNYTTNDDMTLVIVKRSE